MKRKWIDPKTVKIDIHNCSRCGIKPEIHKEEYEDLPSLYFLRCPCCGKYAFSKVSLDSAVTYWNQLQERGF